jgi:hypothetical protein
MNIAHTDLGPLPASDDNAALQRESIKALNALLKGQDQIIFRDERTEDYGVDGSFELNLKGRMTNIRSQVQLKASSDCAPNRDGSRSLSIKTTNLNYLLNGPAPMYLLYDAANEQFFYTWARDESRRLEATTPEWRDQSTVTLRFVEQLSQSSLGTLYKRALNEGIIQRGIRDRLARATEGEPVVLSVDADSLQIDDADRARDVLLASGAAIVASGYPKEVLRLAKLVTSAFQLNPRVQLAIGYAEFTLGNYYVAYGNIRRVLARIIELSPSDKSFLDRLKDGCEFHMGLIDTTIYESRLKVQAEELSGVDQLAAKHQMIYRTCLDEGDLAKRADLVRQLGLVTQELLDRSDASDGLKLGSRLALLNVEGIQISLDLSRKVFHAAIRTFLFPADTPAVARTLANAVSGSSDWRTKANDALRDAYELNHPLLIVQAITVWLNVEVGRLLDLRMDAISLGQPFVVPEPIKTAIQKRLKDALDRCYLNEAVEARLSIRKIETEFLEIQGNLAEAKSLADSFYSEAEAMGFKMAAERAREIIEDRTLLMLYTKQCEELKGEDRDWGTSRISDEQLDRLSFEMTAIIGSPPANPKKVRGHLRSFRIISQERCEWCRHLQLQELLHQTTNHLTAMAVTPMRKCWCERFEYQSQGESTDVIVLIEDFKRDYCRECGARSPKAKSGNPG